MRGLTLSVGMALGFAVGLAAQDKGTEEKASSVEELIRQLGHDDVQVRDKAQAKLIEIGAPCLEELRRALEGEKDPEVRERLEICIGRVSWYECWKTDALELVKAHLRQEKCAECGKEMPDKPQREIKHDLLAKRMPGVKFFEIRFDCCLDVNPPRVRILGIGRKYREFIDVTTVEDLKPFLPAAKGKEEAKEIAAIAISLLNQSLARGSTRISIADAANASVDERDETFVVRYIEDGLGARKRVHAVSFDKEGLLNSYGRSLSPTGK